MDFLTAPLLAAMAVLGLAVISDPEAVHFRDVSVPQSLEDAGYTGDAIEARLIAAMRTVAEEANTRAPVHRLAAASDPTMVMLVSDLFGTTDFVRAVRQGAGLLSFAFDGEVVEKPGGLEFTLRGTERGGHRHVIVVSHGRDDVDGLIQEAALATIAVIDPYVRAAWQFERDRDRGNFEATKRLLSGAGPERPWLFNLSGVVAFVEGDTEGAVARFRAVREHDPTFAAALFNEGVAEAHRGRHDAAVALFKQVAEHAAGPGSPPGIRAAAYDEWGVSLAALGRTDDAVAAFRLAQRVDPAFPTTYVDWADVLDEAGRTEEAAQLRRQAAALRGEELCAELLTEALKRPRPAS
ncbi:tetratricopeptide repeat protein [Azospirillum sp. A39]|uniref:tetratricopeptide repeat protein n=1 Tax=Azospirillum sp. A39 TaxID=3462279 RepID=UPI004046009C